MKLFAVRDLKANVFLKPVADLNVASATRSFGLVVNEGSSMISKYPADFALYEIGDFDEVTGMITVAPAPTSLGIGTDFVEEKKVVQ